MSLISQLHNSKLFSLFAIFLLAVPSLAQQGNQQSPPPSTQQPAPAQAQVSTPSAPQPKPLPTPTGVDYSKPAPFFPNIIAPYRPRHVAEPALTDAPKINDLLREGKIMLSLNDAIALALANNLDLAIARYNLPIADTDLLLTRAGGSPRGVNSGVVQGTPGGTGASGACAQGSGAGGTSAAAGGAGAGASGQVLSTSGAGPSPDSFDPVLSGTLSLEHAVFPLSNTVTTGTNSLQHNTTTGNFSYFQGFSTGTALTVGFQNNRIASSNRFNTLNPTLSSNFRATVRQHLLQGFSHRGELAYRHHVGGSL